MAFLRDVTYIILPKFQGDFVLSEISRGTEKNKNVPGIKRYALNSPDETLAPKEALTR